MICDTVESNGIPDNIAMVLCAWFDARCRVHSRSTFASCRAIGCVRVPFSHGRAFRFRHIGRDFRTCQNRASWRSVVSWFARTSVCPGQTRWHARVSLLGCRLVSALQ
jgi:hypothetical protein